MRPAAHPTSRMRCSSSRRVPARSTTPSIDSTSTRPLERYVSASGPQPSQSSRGGTGRSGLVASRGADLSSTWYDCPSACSGKYFDVMYGFEMMRSCATKSFTIRRANRSAIRRRGFICQESMRHARQIGGCAEHSPAVHSRRIVAGLRLRHRMVGTSVAETATPMSPRATAAMTPASLGDV